MQCDLYSFLISAPITVTDPDRAAAMAALRAAVGTRMFPDVLTEGCQLPALTYSLISETVEHTIDGLNDGLFLPRVQIDAWATTRSECNAVAQDVIDSLDGYTNAPMGAMWVNALIWENSVDSYEDVRKQYRRAMDFHIINTVGYE
jgi:hypothetical protein